MPASKHTRLATTPKRARMWGHVRKSMEQRGASPGAAVRAANAVVKRAAGKSRRGK